MNRTLRRWSLVLVSMLPAIGCGGDVRPAQEPTAWASASAVTDKPSYPADPPLQPLRSGAATVAEGRKMQATTVATTTFKGRPATLLSIPFTAGQASHFDAYLMVDAGGDGIAPLVVREPSNSRSERRFWIIGHRGGLGAGHLSVGHLNASAVAGDLPRRFAIEHDGNKPAPQPELEGNVLTALQQHFAQRTWRGGPWYRFASARLKSTQASTGNGAMRGRPGGNSDLALLMETTTGMTSLQEALQTDRPLFMAMASEKRVVDVAQLKPPQLAAHAFAKMMKGPPPAEPLATNVPAEFYYLRFNRFAQMLLLLDQMDAWGTPINNVLDGRSENRFLADRYETQLGLSRGPLTRSLGPKVIRKLAVVGSDPYLRAGTDITIIFDVASRMLLSAGLATSLNKHIEQHGSISRDQAKHQGVTIRRIVSKDGAINQHRASIGELELVSNSPAAIRRVIDTIVGKHPSLGKEPDFRFMLSRTQDSHHDGMAFFGDRFVMEVVGPKQKILEARRQLALAELSTPGYAYLLHGWLFGKPPKDLSGLIGSGLFKRNELKHRGGGTIRWQPGSAARSRWGTPAALTPLIDAPAVKKITHSEQRSYQRFANSYQRNWSGYIDPAMLRFRLRSCEDDAKETCVDADLRVLPLIDNSEYNELTELVGDQRITAAPIDNGIQVALGIGKNAKLRRALQREARSWMPTSRLRLDWLGSWALIGVQDRTHLANALRFAFRKLQPPSKHSIGIGADELAEISQLPAYAAIDLASVLPLRLALVALRQLVMDADADIEWGAHRRHDGVNIVAIRVREDDKRGISLFYAISGKALLLTTRDEVMTSLIDRQKSGSLVEPNKGHTQLSTQLRAGQSDGLKTLVGWALEEQARKSMGRSRHATTALFRGLGPKASADNVRQAALNIFGALPVTPDGQAYQLGPAGVVDRKRGTPEAPRWPALPVRPSPIATLLDVVTGFKTELSFDDEGQAPDGSRMRSLRAQVSLRLNAAAAERQ